MEYKQYENDTNHTSIFCIKCGNKLLPDSIFCEKCGTKTPLQNTIGPVITQKDTYKKKPSKSTIILFSIIGILLISTILVAMFVISDRCKNDAFDDDSLFSYQETSDDLKANNDNVSTTKSKNANNYQTSTQKPSSNSSKSALSDYCLLHDN